MSISTNAQPATATVIEDRKSRAYKDYSTSSLVEMLERDYDQERPFNELIVFEVANRLMEAETGTESSQR